MPIRLCGKNLWIAAAEHGQQEKWNHPRPCYHPCHFILRIIGDNHLLLVHHLVSPVSSTMAPTITAPGWTCRTTKKSIMHNFGKPPGRRLKHPPYHSSSSSSSHNHTNIIHHKHHYNPVPRCTCTTYRVNFPIPTRHDYRHGHMPLGK